jgi:hypothetical protein
MISLMNHELLEIHKVINVEENYFSIPEMDDVLNDQVAILLNDWLPATGLKSWRRWQKDWIAKISGA